jgi:hypothetical protein
MFHIMQRKVLYISVVNYFRAITCYSFWKIRNYTEDGGSNLLQNTGDCILHGITSQEKMIYTELLSWPHNSHIREYMEVPTLSVNTVHTYIHTYIHTHTHIHTYTFHRSNTCHRTAEYEMYHDYTIDNIYRQIKTYDKTPNSII